MTDFPPDEHPFFDAMRQQFIDRPLPSGRPAPRARFGRARFGRASLGRPRTPRSGRPWSLAGAGVVLAAAIAALVIALGARSAAPASAYAVTVHSDHTVTIYLREWKAIGTLNNRLASLNMRIRVVPIVHGCDAPVHEVIYAAGHTPTHIAPGPARTLQSGPVGEPFAALTTWNDTLPGRTRIFTANRSGEWGEVYTVVGPAPLCVGDGD